MRAGRGTTLHQVLALAKEDVRCKYTWPKYNSNQHPNLYPQNACAREEGKRWSPAIVTNGLDNCAEPLTGTPLAADCPYLTDSCGKAKDPAACKGLFEYMLPIT